MKINLNDYTWEEAKDLAEEGIPFAPLPWNDDKAN